MRIVCESNDENIRKASSLVMKHYADEGFLNNIREVDYFNHTNQSPVMVASVLEIAPKNMTVIVKEYKHWNPFSKVVGYASGNTIFFNTRKSGSWLDRVETMYHELCHICGYSHKGNRVNSYNLLSVPYKASNIFKNYVKEIYWE